MTPQERAEKIAYISGHQPNTEILRDLIPAIAAQIEEAEREAYSQGFKYGRVNGFAEGFLAARDEAAEIARQYSCHALGGTEAQQRWAHEIRERLSQLTPEGEKI